LLASQPQVHVLAIVEIVLERFPTYAVNFPRLQGLGPGRFVIWTKDNMS
jgi:hypothetical protein